MSIYIPPEAIIADFIREKVTDPNSDREYVEGIDTILTTSPQTEFLISPPSGSVSHITSIEVNEAEINKWKDYYWDYKGSKVIINSDNVTIESGDTVVINYKYSSTNWVYADKPAKKLSYDAFPRVRVYKVSQTGERLGNYKTPVESSIRFQVDVWSKESQVYTISGLGDDRSYSGEALANILSLNIRKELEDNTDDLYPLFYDYDLNNLFLQGFDSEYQAFHYIYEFSIKSTTSGIIN